MNKKSITDYKGINYYNDPFPKFTPRNKQYAHVKSKVDSGRFEEKRSLSSVSNSTVNPIVTLPRNMQKTLDNIKRANSSPGDTMMSRTKSNLRFKHIKSKVDCNLDNKYHLQATNTARTRCRSPSSNSSHSAAATSRGSSQPRCSGNKSK